MRDKFSNLSRDAYKPKNRQDLRGKGRYDSRYGTGTFYINSVIALGFHFFFVCYFIYFIVVKVVTELDHT